MLLKVNPHKIEIDKSPVNEREINISKCQFEFTNEITNDYVKEAYFTFEGSTYKQIIVNDECDFPSEVLVKKGQVKIGVVAYLVENETEIKRYNPSPAYFNTWDGSLVDNAENSEPITPTDKEQIEQNIVNLQNDVDDLEENKQDKLVSGENIKTINGESVLGSGNIEIYADLSDYYTKEEVDQSQATQNENISQNTDDIETINNSLTNYSLITETGSQIALNINSSNYQMTAILKDKNGNVIHTSNVIDLPIESMIIDIDYDSATKEIVFTLQNGNVLRVSVADLVSGLVSTDELNTILGNYYTKSEIETLLTDYVKNTDYATSSKGGVIKSGYGTSINNNGVIYATTKNYSDYQTVQNELFISKGTLENVITGKELINQDALTQSQGIQDANIEENASNIEELQSIVDQLPHEEGEGTDIELELTIEAKMSVGEAGNSSQFSTEGYQVLNLEKYPYSESQSVLNGGTVSINNGIITVNGTSATGGMTIKSAELGSSTRDTIPAGTYYFGVRTNGFLIENGTSTFKQYREGVNTLPSSYSISQWFFPAAAGSTTTKPLLISNNSSKTTYEPYTDGPAPNPDYPYPVKSVTGENSLVIQNKNLFDGVRKNVYFNNSNQFFERADASTTDFISAKEGDKFTISTEIASNGIVIASFDENYNCLLRSASGASSLTLTHTCPANTKYIIGSNYIGMNTQTMLVKGSTAPSTYVPHEEQNYQLSLGNIELNSSPDGTIRDAIIGTPDNWVKREYIGKVVLDGSENWETQWSIAGGNNVNGYRTNIADILKTTSSSDMPKMFCNYYTVSTQNDCGFNSGRICSRTNQSQIIITNNDILNANDFKAWLSTHNTIVYYVLATPQDIPITDTTLINQLNEIYNNAHSYKGTTNITSTYANGNEQMYLDASALTDISKKIDTLTNAIIELGGE